MIHNFWGFIKCNSVNVCFPIEFLMFSFTFITLSLSVGANQGNKRKLIFILILKRLYRWSIYPHISERYTPFQQYCGVLQLAMCKYTKHFQSIKISVFESWNTYTQHTFIRFVWLGMLSFAICGVFLLWVEKKEIVNTL